MTEQTADETTEKKVPEKFQSFVETIEKMSVLDLAELVGVLENKFGVSAAAFVAAAPSLASDSGAPAPAEESATLNVQLTNAGGQKIQVIKVLREALGIGLKDAKDLTDAAPKVVKEGMARKDAEELKKKLEEAGASVELT